MSLNQEPCDCSIPKENARAHTMPAARGHLKQENSRKYSPSSPPHPYVHGGRRMRKDPGRGWVRDTLWTGTRAVAAPAPVLRAKYDPCSWLVNRVCFLHFCEIYYCDDMTFPSLYITHKYDLAPWLYNHVVIFPPPDREEHIWPRDLGLRDQCGNRVKFLLSPLWKKVNFSTTVLG